MTSDQLLEKALYSSASIHYFILLKVVQRFYQKWS
ncbi:hypothetical protein EDB36_12214 [Vibrio crassostreae]|nr:hypothetical protein EDB36_12214 [Vibrio crassostreae]